MQVGCEGRAVAGRMYGTAYAATVVGTTLRSSLRSGQLQATRRHAHAATQYREHAGRTGRARHRSRQPPSRHMQYGGVLGSRDRVIGANPQGARVRARRAADSLARRSVRPPGQRPTSMHRGTRRRVSRTTRCPLPHQPTRSRRSRRPRTSIAPGPPSRTSRTGRGSREVPGRRRGAGT